MHEHTGFRYPNNATLVQDERMTGSDTRTDASCVMAQIRSEGNPFSSVCEWHRLAQSRGFFAPYASVAQLHRGLSSPYPACVCVNTCEELFGILVDVASVSKIEHCLSWISAIIGIATDFKNDVG